MRNFSKYHYPSKEFSKIVRFNGKEYLLRSVYDNNEAQPSEEQPAFDREYFKTDTYLDELPWFKYIKHKRQKANRRRIMEGIYDDFDDDFFDEMEDEEEQNPSSNEEQELSSSFYTIFKKDGSSFDIQLSDDATKDIIFHLFNMITTFVCTDTENYDSVDKILYNYGNSKMKSYKMDISGITYDRGMFELEVGGSLKLGYIQAYFTNERDVKFTIYAPGINNKGDQKLVSFSYAEFCDMLRNDRITSKEKVSTDYYYNILSVLMIYFHKQNINMTICKEKSASVFNFNLEGAQFLRNNFTVEKKYTYEDITIGSISPYLSGKCADTIDRIWNGENVDAKAADDTWILLGNNDYFISRLLKSYWFKYADMINDTDYKLIEVRQQNPKVRTKVDIHYILALPISKFITISPVLVTYLS